VSSGAFGQMQNARGTMLCDKVARFRKVSPKWIELSRVLLRNLPQKCIVVDWSGVEWREKEKTEKKLN